tara:strand:- start:3186 stop:3968 length:783 start_codon:yes stop_codon:yes gene_type:complete
MSQPVHSAKLREQAAKNWIVGLRKRQQAAFPHGPFCYQKQLNQVEKAAPESQEAAEAEATEKEAPSQAPAATEKEAPSQAPAATEKEAPSQAPAATEKAAQETRAASEPAAAAIAPTAVRRPRSPPEWLGMDLNSTDDESTDDEYGQTARATHPKFNKPKMNTAPEPEPAPATSDAVLCEEILGAFKQSKLASLGDHVDFLVFKETPFYKLVVKRRQGGQSAGTKDSTIKVLGVLKKRLGTPTLRSEREILRKFAAIQNC